jgi:lambda family phage portal protein
MNLLDRAIAYVAPAWGSQRARLRVGAASGYDAAKRELAAFRNMVARSQTADADALPNLEEMHARSRKLIMNAPLAGGAVGTVVTNVVGVGLRMSPQADGPALAALAGITSEQVKAFEAAAEREWRLFCRAEHADMAGELSFAAIQEIAFRSVLGDGDCFAATVAAPRGGPFDFALQLWDADRVSNPQFRADSETLAGGVERDEGGRPVAYHVAEIHRTTSVKRSWRRVPRMAPDGSPRVLHLVHRERIGQSRGVPYLAPVMAALADLDRYTQAEITAAVLNACIAIIGQSPTADSPLAREAAAASAGTSGGPGFQRAEIAFEPGMVLEGFMPGEDIKSFDGARPNAGFDPFVQAVLRQVGARLGLPFEVLVLHFTASYSAARAALLQAWAFYRGRRAWLAASLCQPTYELVLRNAILRRRLAAPGFLTDPAIRAAWCGARWTGPSPGQIDPLKEVNAAEKRLELRLSTRTRETAELTGDDWEQVAAEFAEEEAMLESLGITAPPEAPAMPTDRPLPAPAPQDDEGEAGDEGDTDREAA